MKKCSTWRFVLAILSAYPAMYGCVLWSLMGIQSVVTFDWRALPYVLPFVACIVIWVYFITDTIKLYRAGK